MWKTTWLLDTNDPTILITEIITLVKLIHDPERKVKAWEGRLRHNIDSEILNATKSVIYIIILNSVFHYWINDRMNLFFYLYVYLFYWWILVCCPTHFHYMRKQGWEWITRWFYLLKLCAIKISFNNMFYLINTLIFDRSHIHNSSPKGYFSFILLFWTTIWSPQWMIFFKCDFLKIIKSNLPVIRDQFRRVW